MTVIVGVKCTDGVVIGADSIATSSQGQRPLLRLEMDKLRFPTPRIILAGTGSVGLGQRFEEVIIRAIAKDAHKEKVVEFARQLAEDGVRNFQSTGIALQRDTGYGYGALVAAPIGKSAHLIEFSGTDFQPDIRDDKLFFASMGSGQNLAEPFLAFISRVIWNGEPPNTQKALFGVYWALQHCIQCAPGFVGPPIHLAVLRKQGDSWSAETVDEKGLQEQLQHIDALENHIREFDLMASAKAEEVPQPKASA